MSSVLSSAAFYHDFFPRRCLDRFRYFLYVIFGPIGSSARDGISSIRWAEMGEATPTSPEGTIEWFQPLANALKALYGATHYWTSRFTE